MEPKVSRPAVHRRHPATPFIPNLLNGIATTVLALVLIGSAALPAIAADSNDSSLPAITAVLNNYSYLLPDNPNYGIAPGSLFVIFGSGLATPGAPAVLQDSSKKDPVTGAAVGLPLTLNNASIAVTVSGLTVHPALYYATATQIAAVLPSNTPIGTATLTVTYNGVTSAPATFPVVRSAPGLATMSGTGAGPVMATDANYSFVSPTSSAAAGQIITLWGTGLGASPADSDTTYTATPHQITGAQFAVFFGSQQMPVVWAGRSGYPGLDQINVQVPVPSYTPAGCNNTTCTYATWVDLPLGCSTSLTMAASSTGVGSNTVTLPTSMTGGSCTLPPFVLDPSVAQSFGGQASVHFGFLSVSQHAGQAMAGGSFIGLQGASLAGFAGSKTASGGSCVILPQVASYDGNGLSAGGAIAITGPAGQQPLSSGDYADYGGVLPASMIPAAGGTFNFVCGGGGPYGTVGPFNTAVRFPTPIEWTNQTSIYGINRSQGVQLTWTGGDADGLVTIRGSSFAPAGSQTPGGSFICSVPASAGEFTVPSTILQALPAGAGTLTVENQSAAQSIAASGLDVSYAFGGAMSTINAAYN